VSTIEKEQNADLEKSAFWVLPAGLIIINYDNY